MKSIVVHYQEIALKGRNRPWFVSRLVRNLREATSDLDIKSVRALQGRIEVVLGERAEWTAVRDRLANVFGAANFARAGRTKLDIEVIDGPAIAKKFGTLFDLQPDTVGKLKEVLLPKR